MHATSTLGALAAAVSLGACGQCGVDAVEHDGGMLDGAEDGSRLDGTEARDAGPDREPEPWPRCSRDGGPAECASDHLAASGDGWWACFPPCDAIPDCPIPADSEARRVCYADVAEGPTYCRLPCDRDAECPPQMRCWDLDEFGFRQCVCAAE